MKPLKSILILKLSISMTVLILAVSCSNKEQKKEEKPQPFLDRQEMVDMLVDVRITESAIREMASYGQNTKDLSAYFYRKLFEKHHITPEEFKANLKYYSKDPKQIHDIYGDVITRITEMQAELIKRK